MNKKLYSLYQYLEQNDLCSEASDVYSLYKSAGSGIPFAGCGNDCGSENDNYLLKDNPYVIDLKTTEGIGIGPARIEKTVELMPTIEGGDSSEGLSIKKKLDKPFSLKFTFSRGSNTDISNLCNKTDEIKESLQKSMEEDFLNDNPDLKPYIASISLSKYSCSVPDETVSAKFTFTPKSGLKDHFICLCINASNGSSLSITAYKDPDNPDITDPAVASTDEDDEHGSDKAEAKTGDEDGVSDKDWIRTDGGIIMIDGPCNPPRRGCVDFEVDVDVKLLWKGFMSENNKSYGMQYTQGDTGWSRSNFDYLSSRLLTTESLPVLSNTDKAGKESAGIGTNFHETREFIIKQLIASGSNPQSLLNTKQAYFNNQMKKILRHQVLGATIRADGNPSVGWVRSHITKQLGNPTKYFKDYIFEFFLYHYSKTDTGKAFADRLIKTWHADAKGKLFEEGTEWIDSINIKNYPQ
jgi:hypothetical protein